MNFEERGKYLDSLPARFMASDVYADWKAEREKLFAERERLIGALVKAEPILKRYRIKMGSIPRPGTAPIFFHTLSYEGDVKELQKARRLHREVRAVLEELASQGA